jgi:GMP synthase (glutamine-hydrolysing)
MQPIAILQHNAEVPPGYLADAIENAGLPSIIVRLDLGQALPEINDVSGLVSLGGIMGAYEEDQHEFLAAEKELLRDAVARELPVLGICLGCQLLADSLGGSAFKADSHEVEFGPLYVAAAATDDGVIGPLATDVLSFHGDTWEPPPGAEVLARSERYPHAFRFGSAVGVQAHPEASTEIARGWVEHYGREKLLAEGVDPDRLLADMDVAEEANASRAVVMFTAWLNEVVAAAS